MNTQQVHTKRAKRTSIKKADRYRKEAAFNRQRYTTLVSDLRKTGNNLDVLSTEKELLSKNETELRDQIMTLENHIQWIKGFWLVKIALFFIRIFRM